MKFLRPAGFLLAILVFGGAAWLWDPLPSNPPANILAASAPNYDVEIIRDEWGVPHIFGKTDADAAFGVAYAHAEDDFETIQQVVTATRGVLATYQGVGAAPTDYLVSFLGVWKTVDNRFERDVPDEVKKIARAYAEGLNLYAAQHPRATWKGLAPFRAEDVIAGFIFKTPLFYGLDGKILALFEDERIGEVALDPYEKRKAWHVAPKSPGERGSNAFAVAPHRSGDETTRLIINSHQPMTGPVAWWEAHIVSEEGMDITGGLFPGTPVILHGFNRHLGWTNTVNKPDLTDIYRLTINPDNKKQYRLDGEWRDFEIEKVKINIRLWGPFAFTATRKLLRSAHGPVIEAKHGTYAVRYAGMNEIRQLEQYYRLNKATNFEEFDRALSLGALPSINYVYADQEGNIAFVHNAQYPDRIDNWNWEKDLPGDRSDLIWSDYLPYERVPKLINPKSGFLFNVNNTPFDATDGDDDLKPENFSPTMGLERTQNNRALRVNELVAAIPDQISRDDLLAIKFDTGYAAGSKAEMVVQEILSHDWSFDPKLSEAAEHLASWDFKMDADSAVAALGGLTVLPAVTEWITGKTAPPPKEVFEESVAYLHKHHGRIDPLWGDLNILVRGDVRLPLDGGAGTLRAIYPTEVSDDGLLRANAGDTWMAIVEWDATGAMSAEVIHQFGSSTLDETSRHYADQASLFAAQKWRRALINRAEIEQRAERIYRPADAKTASE